MTSPRCRKCGATDPAAFHPSMRGQCRSCLAAWQRGYRARQRGEPAWARTQRRYALRKRYGIEPEDFQRLHDHQGGRCAVCRIEVSTLSGTPRHRLLHVDHDHDTGVVRGLLCNGCNRAIGYISDNPATARAMAEYLEAHARKASAP